MNHSKGSEVREHISLLLVTLLAVFREISRDIGSPGINLRYQGPPLLRPAEWGKRTDCTFGVSIAAPRFRQDAQPPAASSPMESAPLEPHTEIQYGARAY